MNYLPVYLNITNKKILIIGGGKVAAFKLERLLQFTENVTVLAKEVVVDIRSSVIKVIQSEYASDVLDGFALIYSCTNNRELNRRIENDAEKLKIPVNVVDDPNLCDFISPAVYTDKNFSIAVSTFGTAPSGAAKVRDMIKKALPPDQLNRIVEEEKKKRANQNGEGQ